MHPLVWPTLLMFVGLALIVVEVFVPSAGVIGFLSIVSVVSSVGLAFYQNGPLVGFIFLTVALIGTPGLLVLAFHFWPRTPMGRRILLDLPRADEVLPDSPARRTLRQLVGQFGVAKSKMLPSGAVLIAGMTVDAVSEGVAIEEGTRVKVVEVRGHRVVVRPALAEEAAAIDPDDVLSQSIEKLGLNPYEDPLA